MAEKTFNNRSAASLQMVLLVRQGSNPANYAKKWYSPCVQDKQEQFSTEVKKIRS